MLADLLFEPTSPPPPPSKARAFLGVLGVSAVMGVILAVAGAVIAAATYAFFAPGVTAYLASSEARAAVAAYEQLTATTGQAPTAAQVLAALPATDSLTHTVDGSTITFTASTFTAEHTCTVQFAEGGPIVSGKGC